MKNTTLKDIVDAGWDVATGGCVYASKGALSNEFNEKKGRWELTGDLNRSDLNDLHISYKMDYNELGKFVFGEDANTDLGHVSGVFLAQSSNYDRNYRATSGALIKETLYHLFETGAIQGAIVLKHVEGLQYKTQMITSAEEIDDLPPSVYHSIDYSDTVRLLAETSLQKVAVVAVPWQLDDLYQYIEKRDKKLKDKIGFTIGLLTGWYFSYHVLEALCTYYRYPYKDLDRISYRGKGRSGKTRLTFKDGTEKILPRFTLRSIVAFERYYNVPRFLIEVNPHNMLADLVVGDAHVPECQYSKTGISLVVSRSARARELLLDMKKKGTVKILEKDQELLKRSQGRARLYGDFAYSYMDYLHSIGEYAPSIIGPNKQNHRPIDTKTLQRFHKRLKRRQKLQEHKSYWNILAIKYGLEGLPIFKKLSGQAFGKIMLKFKSSGQNQTVIPEDIKQLFV